MSNLKVIFDGDLTSNQITESNRFSNADFLLFDILSPTLAENEGLELGCALLMEIPVIEKTVTKYVPFKISEYEVGLIGDSKELIAIPREFSETKYNMFVSINLSIDAFIRIYTITRELISEDTNSIVKEILDKINQSQPVSNVIMGMEQNNSNLVNQLPLLGVM